MAQGVLLGEEYSTSYKVEGEWRPDGTEHLEIRGFYDMKSGARVSFSGIANGTRKADGSMVFKGGACFYAPPGKLARLNEMAVVWEAEVDAGGFVLTKGWEWK